MSILKRIIASGLMVLMPAAVGFAMDYKEAPMLERLVASGDLPPVEQRVSDNPFVVGPGVLNGTQFLDWTVGNYSDGRVMSAFEDSYHTKIVGIIPNILWSPDQSTKDPVGTIVEDFGWNDDYTVFNFTIRKGLKWSNGDEVTTEDVRFTFEDLYQYPDAGISYTSQLHALGNVKFPAAELEVKDRHSFSLTFDRPYGFFVTELISWISTAGEGIFKPSQFLKQYHPKYTDVAKLNDMAKAAGLEKWDQHLQAKTGNHWQILLGSVHMIGVPSILPYILTEADGTTIRLERNPYFYQVDTEGQQLPYIDAIETTMVEDEGARMLKILAGEADWVVSDWAKMPLMPSFVSGAEKGNYSVQLADGFVGPPTLFINHDYDYKNPNSQWQVLMQDPEGRFGRAVSLAVDNQDINNTVFFGQYKMDGIITGSDFDLAEASQLLDELGLDNKGADGFRTYPDGSPLEITISAITADPANVDVGQLIAQNLKQIGLNVIAEGVDGGIFNQKVANNEYQMTMFWNDVPAWPSGISVDFWPSFKGGWAPDSAKYIDTNGETGRKPPAYLQEFFDIINDRKAVAPGSPEGAVQYARLTDWFADNNVMIWPTGNIVQPIIASNDLGNVVNDGYGVLFGWIHAVQQWYFKE